MKTVIWDVIAICLIILFLCGFSNYLIQQRKSIPQPRYEIQHQWNLYKTNDIRKSGGWVEFTDSITGKKYSLTGTMSIQEN